MSIKIVNLPISIAIFLYIYKIWHILNRIILNLKFIRPKYGLPYVLPRYFVHDVGHNATAVIWKVVCMFTVNRMLFVYRKLLKK